jgi:organic radical activating enzyme
MKSNYPIIPILNQKSKFFCAAKWTELYLYHNHGLSNSCHHPIPHEIPADLLRDPFVLHNTPHKLKMQQLMMDGHKPEECHMCWHIEDSDSDAVSDRFVKSQKWAKEVESLVPDKHNVPKMVEVVFDNYCNLQCSYCDSGQSSSWATRITQNPLLLETDYRHLYSKVHIAPGSTKQEYLAAWNQWWPSISSKVEYVKVSGGEPLMSPNFWNFIDSGVDAPTTSLSINSNFSVKPQLVDKFISATTGFKQVLIGASIDATGAIAEYARQGLTYQLFRDNIDRYLSTTDSKYRLYLQSTVRILSVWGLIDKLNLNLELKQQYPGRISSMYTTVVRFPEFQNVLLLPEALTQKLSNDVGTWLAHNRTYLSVDEQSVVNKIRTYLETRPEPLNAIDQGKLKLDFKKFLLYYNNTSKHNYRDIYPAEFVDWIETIK